MKLNKSKKEKSPSASTDGSDFAPGRFRLDTAEKYFERGVKATVERNRWFLIAVVLGVGHVVNGFSWNAFLPLKTIETIQVNKVEGGRLVADGTVVGNWVPDQDSIAYFINQWAMSVFDINRATIDSTLAKSVEQVVGTAKIQLQELRRNSNPLLLLNQHPEYSRSYEFSTINFIKDDVALLRFRTVSRTSPRSQPVTVTYAMTVTFSRIKPTTRAAVMKNPAGLYITNFNLTEEAVTK